MGFNQTIRISKTTTNGNREVTNSLVVLNTRNNHWLSRVLDKYDEWGDKGELTQYDIENLRQSLEQDSVPMGYPDTLGGEAESHEHWKETYHLIRHLKRALRWGFVVEYSSN